MAYETKDMTGSLFKNDKRTKDSQPHAKGKCMIGGVLYWISAWTNEGAKGRYQSLKFEPVDEQGERTVGAGFQHPQRAPKEKTADPFTDEQHFTDETIPF